jgi:4-amino-4-deoxy-L-arabinose transferase-like glycosyltransferase
MKSLRLPVQLYLLGLFLAGALLAFSINLNNYFLSDDFAQIGRVLSGDFSVIWGLEHGGFFRPLFIWSYVIDSRIWGAHPFGYHLTNVLIHGLNSFLVFQLGRELFSDLKAGSRNAVAAGAAALFLLHPSHTEAVVWISGRADLFATFFVLASLLSYLAFANKSRKSYLVLSLACFALALLAKESAICLPFLVLVIGVSSKRARGGSTKRFLGIVALFVSILIVFIMIRAFFIGSVVGGYGVTQHLNFSPGWIRDRLLEASVRSILPTLPSAWSIFLFKPLQSPLFFLIVIVVCGLTTAAIVFRRKWYDALERKAQNQLLVLLAALFLVSLLPVINLKLNLYQTLGERFLYLPTVFSCLLVAYVSLALVRNRKVWLLILIGILGCYSWNLYRTNRDWQEAARLSHDIQSELVAVASQDRLVVLNAPDNLRGVPIFHNGLAEALQFFQHHKSIKRIDIVAFQNLNSTGDRIDSVSDGEIISLRTRNVFDTFDRVSPVECLEIDSQSSTALQLRRQPCLATADIVFFSSGKINQLPAE